MENNIKSEDSVNKLNICKSCENLTDNNNNKIDNHFIIDGYVYAFKKDLKRDNISLRCKNRTN